jgi:hypothetical protein
MKRTALLIIIFAAACTDGAAQPETESPAAAKDPQPRTREKATASKNDTPGTVKDVPAHSVWIECAGTERDQDSDEEGRVESTDEVRPITTLFVIDDASKQLYMYDRDEKGFASSVVVARKTSLQAASRGATVSEPKTA